MNLSFSKWFFTFALVNKDFNNSNFFINQPNFSWIVLELTLSWGFDNFVCSVHIPNISPLPSCWSKKFVVVDSVRSSGDESLWWAVLVKNMHQICVNMHKFMGSPHSDNTFKCSSSIPTGCPRDCLFNISWTNKPISKHLFLLKTENHM